jgi:predicted AAA+ superfamily ATPase
MTEVLRQLRPALLEHVVKKQKSLLLLGPRQTGKSFLLKGLHPQIVINLAKESEFQDHLKNPKLIEKIVAPLIGDLKKRALVFIDEIQRIPEMMNTVQALIDDHRSLVFLISGSSPRKLKQKHINLLPGRLFSHQLFPLTFWELGQDFDLKTCLKRGSLPEIYLNEYGPDLLAEYIDSYLREEIMAEALVRNVATFSRFVDLAAASSWQELNYSKLASDSEIPKETIRRYVDILSETLLIFRIPGFTEIHSPRRATQKEKFLFFDVGVRNAILKIQKNSTFTNEQYGSLFEQWLILQFIALKSYQKKNWKFFYYRDDRQNEIDFIVEEPKKIIAIEIKWGEKYRDEWKDSLITFKEQNIDKPVELIILYRGDRVLKDGDVQIFPYEKYLQDLI